MKPYERLSTFPIEMTPERNVLAASGEVTNCKIDPINVEVEEFIDVDKTKTFSLDLE